MTLTTSAFGTFPAPERHLTIMPSLDPIASYYVSDANAALMRAYAACRQEMEGTTEPFTIGEKVIERARELVDVARALEHLLTTAGIRL